MRLTRNVRLRLAGLAVAYGVGLGCSSTYDPYCGPEIRITVVGNQIRGSTGIDYGLVDVTVEERRGDANDQRIYIVAMGPTGTGGGVLKGHVTAAEVIGASGNVLHRFTVTAGPSDQIIGTGEAQLTAESATALRNEFLRGSARLLLRTDLADPRTFDIALPIRGAGDWGRANCS